MTVWPFPPPGGPIPWTAKQKQKYKKEQQAKWPTAPF